MKKTEEKNKTKPKKTNTETPQTACPPRHRASLASLHLENRTVEVN